MAEEGKTIVTNRKFISTSNTYFDDYLKPNYWSKIAKDYKHILFKAGKPLQSRELNTLQSLFHDRVKTMCDITYRNGSVVRGISVYSNHIAADNVDDTSNTEANEDIIIRNTDGVVYWDGIFFDIEEKSINIDNQFVGKNRIVVNHNQPIYVYLIPIYEVVNSSVDHNLLDPAIRYKIDEGVAGADRLSIRFELRAYNINDSMIPEQRILIAVIDTGNNVSLKNRDYTLDDDSDVGGITEVLSGLKIRNNKTYYEVESGNGTIKGHDVNFDGYERFEVDKIREDLEYNNYNLFENTEYKPLDVRDNPLRGAIWGDVKYERHNIADNYNELTDFIQNDLGIEDELDNIRNLIITNRQLYGIYISKNDNAEKADMMFNGMFLPGQKVIFGYMETPEGGKEEQFTPIVDENETEITAEIAEDYLITVPNYNRFVSLANGGDIEIEE